MELLKKHPNLDIILKTTIASYIALKIGSRKIDPYTRFTIGCVVALILITIGAKQNKTLIPLGIGIGCGSFLTFEELLRVGGKLLKNDYTKDVYVLHETKGVIKLDLNKFPDIRIDGITYKGMKGVYKVSDGVFVDISQNGEIIANSYWGKKVILKKNAGLKDLAWCQSKTTPTDNRWLDLYAKSL
jgi:hypothetical protein